jgi:MFS superfamily sulfate permease-like transporter
MAVLRFDGALSLRSFRATQSEFIRWAKSRPTVRTVVLVASTFDQLDATQQENLGLFAAAVREAGYRLAFAGFSDSVFGGLARRGTADEIGLDSFYPSEITALADVFRGAHQDRSEENCPLEELMPRLVSISAHPDGTLRDARHHGLDLCEHLVAFRFEGPMNFSTIGYFEDGVSDLLKAHPDARHVLFACHTISRIDEVAAELLVHFLETLQEVGFTVALSDLKGETLEMLRRAPNWSLEDALYPTLARAIRTLYPDAHRESKEEECPFREFALSDGD